MRRIEGLARPGVAAALGASLLPVFTALIAWMVFTAQADRRVGLGTLSGVVGTVVAS
jgi:hypothetical protein